MLNAARVFTLRRYYRFVNWRAWRRSGLPAGEPLELPTEAGALRARRFGGGPGCGDRPVIAWFHGGGWVIGDLRTHAPFCAALAQGTGCTVVAVDYRLAPEHPFPAALEDCTAAVAWLRANLGDLGPNDGRLVVGGDSAGGNLAACCTLATDPAGAGAELAPICGTLLIYPVTDHYEGDQPSYRERADSQLLTAGLMRWFWDNYLGGADPQAPAVQVTMPLRSESLAGLPPTLLVTAEFDPLRDEGLAFRRRAAAEGVRITHHHYDAAEHGFACGGGPTPELEQLLQQVSAWRHSLGG